MRWNNKGHQFDEIANIVLNTSQQFYIWGAGLAGQAFYRQLNPNDKQRVKGYIDSSVYRQNILVESKTVFSPEMLHVDEQDVVVIATLDFIEAIETTLIQMGKKENYDFFYSHVFLSILKMYRDNKLYMHHLNVHVTEKCTYQCADCSLFMAHNKNPHDISLKDVLYDVDLYFKWVDYVQELHVIGGEPFIYPYLTEVITYIGENYRHNIGEFAIATNGTILPKEELLEVCCKYGVFLSISDYSKSPVFNKKNRIKEICSLLQKKSVGYRIGYKNQWFDFGNQVTDRKDYTSEEALTKKFEQCFFRNRVTYQNKLYYCHRQAAGVWAGIGDNSKESYFSLENYSPDKKKTLMEFDLGYNELGYLHFCNGCNGYERVNKKFINAARQLD